MVRGEMSVVYTCVCVGGGWVCLCVEGGGELK